MCTKLITEKLANPWYLNYKTRFSLIFMQDSGKNLIATAQPAEQGRVNPFGTVNPVLESFWVSPMSRDVVLKAG
jgi:hypothetical protein